MRLILLCFFCLLDKVIGFFPYKVILISNSPVVIGANVTINATVLYDGKPKKDNYNFYWVDKTHPEINYEETSNSAYASWNVHYNPAKYSPGIYEIELKVYAYFSLINVNVGKQTIKIVLNDFLNGNLMILQDNIVRETTFVSSASPLKEIISLKSSDMDLIKNKATQIRTYWFRDCMFLGFTNNLSTDALLTESNRVYNLEVLIVASYENFTKNSVIHNETLLTTTTTMVPPVVEALNTSKTNIQINQTINDTIKDPVKIKRKRSLLVMEQNSPFDVNNITSTIEARKSFATNQNIFALVNLKQDKYFKSKNSDFIGNNEFICFNKSNIARDRTKTYGYFTRQVIVKDPITNITISGNFWLQFGEILSLEAKCFGSPPLEYCVKIHPGLFNATENLNCTTWNPINSCDFGISHFLNEAETYTVIVAVKNDLSMNFTQVAVNIYQVKKGSQLSVIVVPVSFCLIAVIFVVFTVAYYIQNKNRLVVEVADFNFGETSSVDMEYKTFTQRLIDSILDVINCKKQNTPAFRNDESSSSLKYGSMT